MGPGGEPEMLEQKPRQHGQGRNDRGKGPAMLKGVTADADHVKHPDDGQGADGPQVAAQNGKRERSQHQRQGEEVAKREAAKVVKAPAERLRPGRGLQVKRVREPVSIGDPLKDEHADHQNGTGGQGPPKRVGGQRHGADERLGGDVLTAAEQGIASGRPGELGVRSP
jgi:hypothetical protein